jgi:hypothetical protein
VDETGDGTSALSVVSFDVEAEEWGAGIEQETAAGAPGETKEAVAAPAFDIDDQGRREVVLELSDKTRLQIIQQVFVDWVSGTTADVVLKGWLNRRNANGTVPTNVYTLSLKHVISFTTRRVGRTVPPVSFHPMLDQGSGFVVTAASLTSGRFESEWFSLRANSLYYHYIGGSLVHAVGEPSDNPIDSLSTVAGTLLGGRTYYSPSYNARRGGA